MDHAENTLQQLQGVSSIPDLCKDWTSKYRAIIVASQSILRFFYPHGAQALGVLITLVDGFCATPAPTSTP